MWGRTVEPAQNKLVELRYTDVEDGSYNEGFMLTLPEATNLAKQLLMVAGGARGGVELGIVNSTHSTGDGYFLWAQSGESMHEAMKGDVALCYRMNKLGNTYCFATDPDGAVKLARQLMTAIMEKRSAKVSTDA